MAKIEFKQVNGGFDVFVDGKHFGLFQTRKAALNLLYRKEIERETDSMDWTLQTR